MKSTIPDILLSWWFYSGLKGGFTNTFTPYCLPFSRAFYAKNSSLPHLLIFLRSFLMAAMIYPANIHDSEFEMLVIKKLIGRSLRLKLLANGVV